MSIVVVRCCVVLRSISVVSVAKSSRKERRRNEGRYLYVGTCPRISASVDLLDEEIF